LREIFDQPDAFRFGFGAGGKVAACKAFARSARLPRIFGFAADAGEIVLAHGQFETEARQIALRCL
jgi:hypothetical protein